MTSNGRRILMMHSRYMPDVTGGAELQAQGLACALRERGHAVAVLTSGQWLCRYDEHDSQGFRVFRVRGFGDSSLGGRHLLSNLVWLVSCLLWLYRRRGEYDIIHVHQAKLAAVAGVLAGKILGKPSIVKLGMGGKNSDIAVLARVPIFGPLFKRLLMRHVSTLVAISSEIEAELVEGAGRERVRRIANGLRLKSGDVGSIVKKGGTKRFLYLGRLEYQKGADVLVDAFALCSRKASLPMTLDIVGDGSMLAVVRGKITELGLEGRVSAHGHVRDPKHYLRQSHFLLLPSRGEGMSNAVLEAMAFGVVPVVTDVSGMSDLIEFGACGIRIASADPIAVADAMQLTLNMSNQDIEAMSATAKARVLQRNSMEAVAVAYEALYGDLVAASESDSQAWR